MPGELLSHPHQHPALLGPRWRRVSGLTPVMLGVLVALHAGASEVPRLVADLNTQPRSSDGPEVFTAVGGLSFFVATTPTTGHELWRTDGTVEGTRLVKDALPGRGDSWPGNLTAVGGLLFFTAYDERGRSATWRSDGTTEGTWRVGRGPRDGTSAWFTDMDGVAFYVAAGDAYGYDNELWRSDGTPEGTWRVRDIVPGDAYSDPRWLCAVGGVVFFSAWREDGLAVALWKSDGTEEGTARVKPPFGGPVEFAPRDLVRFGDEVVFVHDSDQSEELWRVDANGVAQLVAGGSALQNPHDLFATDDFVFFEDGNQLWRTDGTPEGTIALSEPADGYLHELDAARVGEAIVFGYEGAAGGYELWRSDGTPEGTAQVVDLRVGGFGGGPLVLLEGNGEAFFVSAPSDTASVILRTDGTGDGTSLAATLPAPFDPLARGELGLAGAAIVASAGDGAGGRVLLRVPVSPGLAMPLADLSRGNGDSNPAQFMLAGGTAWFAARTEGSSPELWRTDGSRASTTREEGVAPPTPSRQWASSVPLASGLLFVGVDDRLWSLGSDRPPQLVEDLGWEYGFAADSELVAWSGAAWFLSRAPGNGFALWRSDGSAPGTHVIREAEGTLGGQPELEVVGDRLFFRADGEVWSSDGTAEGTAMVEDVTPWSGGSSPVELTAAGDRLFFNHGGYTYGRELWVSDGTEEGTDVRDVWPGQDESDPRDLVALGDRVLFHADDGVAGREIWVSDGAGTGTARVLDIAAGEAASDPADLVCFGNVVYFSADDGVHGRELWRSDGSAAGTTIVRDIAPGPASSSVRDVAVWGSKLVFRACDDEAGCEAWTSDGTEAGTQRLADLVPGPLGSDPSTFASDGVRLVFAASTEEHGRELWWVPEPGATAAGATALGTVAALRRRRGAR